jgi:hypothetical protein
MHRFNDVLAVQKTALRVLVVLLRFLPILHFTSGHFDARQGLLCLATIRIGLCVSLTQAARSTRIE